jgi:hypothetical protein
MYIFVVSILNSKIICYATSAVTLMVYDFDFDFNFSLFHPFDNNVYRIHPLLILSFCSSVGMK